MDVCQKAAWTGNVRQLDNVCRWLTVMTPTQLVNEADLPAEVRERPVEIERVIRAIRRDGHDRREHMARTLRIAVRQV